MIMLNNIIEINGANTEKKSIAVTLPSRFHNMINMRS